MDLAAVLSHVLNSFRLALKHAGTVTSDIHIDQAIFEHLNLVCNITVSLLESCYVGHHPTLLQTNGCGTSIASGLT